MEKKKKKQKDFGCSDLLIPPNNIPCSNDTNQPKWEINEKSMYKNGEYYGEIIEVITTPYDDIATLKVEYRGTNKYMQGNITTLHF